MTKKNKKIHFNLPGNWKKNHIICTLYPTKPKRISYYTFKPHKFGRYIYILWPNDFFFAYRSNFSSMAIFPMVLVVFFVLLLLLLFFHQNSCIVNISRPKFVGMSMLGDKEINGAWAQCVSSSCNMKNRAKGKKKKKKKTFLKNNPSKLIKNSVACESFLGERVRVWNPTYRHVPRLIPKTSIDGKWYWFKHHITSSPPI